MGAIKFPHTSGNSMSIAAPATNPASDLELKLPATIGTAGQVLKNSSTAGTLEFANSGTLLQTVRGGDTTEYNVSGQTYINAQALSVTPKSSTSRFMVYLCPIRIELRSGEELNCKVVVGSDESVVTRHQSGSSDGYYTAHPLFYHFNHSLTAGSTVTFQVKIRNGNSGQSDNITYGDNGTASEMIVQEFEP